MPRVKLVLLAAEEVVAEGLGRLAVEGAEMRAVIVTGDKLDAESEAYQNHKCSTCNFETQRVGRNRVQPRVHVRMIEANALAPPPRRSQLDGTFLSKI